MSTLRFYIAVILAVWGLFGASIAQALDARAYIERSVELIEDEQFNLARTYLAPAIIDPSLNSGERSRAFYLRGFSFMAQGMPVSALKDYNRALEFNPNNAVVILELGLLHASGRGTLQDEALAVTFFERSANLGYERASFHLGRAYLYGRGVEKNVQAARTALTEAAQQDHLFAMLNLAASYRPVHVTEPQPELAKAWYEKALNAGEAGALLSIGFMHANGEFGEANAVEAVNYFRQALAEGVQVAGVHLAYAYMTGTGVAEDAAEALRLYNEAADASILTSYVGLGHLYEFGLGVSKDLAEAQRWYEKGANAGELDAMHRLVSYHLRRDSGEARGEALKWSRAAAELGSAQARNDYAWLLATSKFEGLRNGTLALDQASKAVDQQPSASFLDTLAAAYAELGDFEQAVSTQRQAIASITEADGEIKDQLEERLQLYERSEPWRE